MLTQSLITTIGIVSLLSSQGASISGQKQESLIATHEFSLEKRYANKNVNDVFKDNILLNLAYLRGIPKSSEVNWDEVRKPFKYSFTLDSQETFAYHDEVFPEYIGRIDRTTRSNFIASEGFKSDGYLIGDGVCHLASLINWAAKDAGLYVKAKVNHDFAQIPEIPREHGVSIFSTSKEQNLYITNNKQNPIEFVFEYDGENVKVEVKEII